MTPIHARSEKIRNSLREQLDEAFPYFEQSILARRIHAVMHAKTDKDAQKMKGMAALGLSQRIRAGMKDDPRSLREEFDELGSPLLESLAVAFLENWALANEHHRNRPSMLFAMERLMIEAFDFICHGLDAQRVVKSSIPLGQTIYWLPRPLMARAEACELAAESNHASLSTRRSL